MGIRLIVEVLDHWQDAGLTPGERWDLLVLAENANDGTRLTFGPVHAQHILDRANKSPKGWKNAITALMRKKVITTHVPGRIKQVAVYHLEHLCPEPPHSGHKGLCTKPEKDPTAPAKEGHLSGDPVSGEGHLSGDPMGHLLDDPLAREGHPADAKRVIQEVTPTPPVSSFKDSPRTTPSSSVAEDSSNLPAEVGEAEGGGGGDLSSEEQDQNHGRAEAFVDSLDYRDAQPGKKQRQKLITLAAAALAAGWTERGLHRYLDISDDPTVRFPAAIYEYRLAEDELPEAADPEATTLPPACAVCLDANPAAEFNPRLRQRDGQACPDCHPSKVYGQLLPGPDTTFVGWMAVAEQLRESPADRAVAQGQALAEKYRQLEGANQQSSHNAGVIARHRARNGQNGHKPYSNDGWTRMQQLADAGLPPEGVERVRHCGDPECDETTRYRERESTDGTKELSACGKCHPALRF